MTKTGRIAFFRAFIDTITELLQEKQFTIDEWVWVWKNETDSDSNTQDFIRIVRFDISSPDNNADDCLTGDIEIKLEWDDEDGSIQYILVEGHRCEEAKEIIESYCW